jgi:hypothetical protein
MSDLDSEWRRKGATLSHKDGAGGVWAYVGGHRPGNPRWRAPIPGTLMYGSPWLRLLRREVEALVKKRHGANYIKDRQAKTELARINRELKRLKGQMAGLEARKSKLIAGAGK